MNNPMERLQKDRSEPLPRDLERKMGRLFGADFSDVRIAETSLPAEYGTVAVACGNEIRFAPGVIDGWTARAERILAHELTHVLQYRSGRTESTEGEFEREAIRSESGRWARDSRWADRGRVLRLLGYEAGTLETLGITLPKYPPAMPNVAQQKAGASFMVAKRANIVRLAANQVRYRSSERQRLLIEDCNIGQRQSKVFYATREALEEALSLPDLLRSALRFNREPAVAFINRAGQEMFRISPTLLPRQGQEDAKVGGIDMLAPQTCRSFVERCGVPSDSQLSGQVVLAPLLGYTEPENLKDPFWTSEVARLYGRSPLRENHRFLASNHLNDYANPRVGDAYYSASIVGLAKVYQAPIRVYYDYSIPDCIRQFDPFRPPRIPDEIRVVWGDHVGFVAIKDRNDSIVIQNYSRKHEGVEDSDSDPQYFFQMYSILAEQDSQQLERREQTWHSQWSDPGQMSFVGESTLESVPAVDDGKPIREYRIAPGRRVLVNHVTMVQNGPRDS